MVRKMIKIDNSLWMIVSSANLDFLVRVDIYKKKTICEYLFEESMYGKNAISDMIYVSDHLVFAPQESNKIYIYSLRDKTMKKIRLRDMLKDDCPHAYRFFTNTCIYKDYAVLIPHKYSSIVMVNPVTCNLEYIDNYYNDVLSVHDVKCGIFERGRYVNGSMYLLCSGSNHICIYNIEERNFKLVTIGEKDVRLCDICYGNDCFWITDNKGRILKWDKSNNTFRCVFSYSQEKIEKEVTNNDVWDRSLLVDNEHMWIFDFLYPIIRLNMENLTYEIIRREDGIINHVSDQHGFNYTCTVKDEQNFYTVQQWKNEIVKFDAYTTKEKESYSLNSSDDVLLEAYINSIVHMGE